jgi:hypothetical protein
MHAETNPVVLNRTLEEVFIDFLAAVQDARELIDVRLAAIDAYNELMGFKECEFGCTCELCAEFDRQRAAGLV